MVISVSSDPTVRSPLYDSSPASDDSASCRTIDHMLALNCGKRYEEGVQGVEFDQVRHGVGDEGLKCRTDQG